MPIGYSNFQFFIEFYLEDQSGRYVMLDQTYSDAWFTYCGGGEL